MTDVSQLTPRQRNAYMIDKIRSGDPSPYQDGRYVLRVLDAPGRVTGEPRPWPIAITQLDGHRYLCAPNRERDWVKNLLAAGHCTIEGEGEHKAVLAEDEHAATVVATYRAALGSNSNLWPFPADAPVDVIREHLGSVAVFRLEPAYA